MELPRAEDTESYRTGAASLSDSQPSTLYSPDPRIPAGTASTHAFLDSWAPRFCSSQTRPPLRVFPPPAFTSITRNVTRDAPRLEGRGLRPTRPGIGRAWGRWVSLRATPPALATETQPSTASQSQSWLGNQFWPRPQRERGGEELPHLLAFPWLASGGTRPLSKGSRCPPAKAGGAEGHPLTVRPEGLGLPPGLFT